MEVDKFKQMQLPLIIKDTNGIAVGQITVMISHNLTSASFTMSFQNENLVMDNKNIIKAAYDTMQDFFKRELSSCNWSFLFESMDESGEEV